MLNDPPGHESCRRQERPGVPNEGAAERTRDTRGQSSRSAVLCCQVSVEKVLCLISAANGKRRPVPVRGRRTLRGNGNVRLHNLRANAQKHGQRRTNTHIQTPAIFFVFLNDARPHKNTFIELNKHASPSTHCISSAVRLIRPGGTFGRSVLVVG